MQAAEVEELNSARSFTTSRPGSGPLDVVQAIVKRTPMNPSLRFEAMETIQWLRDRLDVREQSSLEYLFSAALIESCFGARHGSEGVHQLLVDKLRTLDRRRQDIPMSGGSFELAVRESQMQRFTLIRSQRITLARACYIAQAMDCDGPSTRSREKDALFTMLTRILCGPVIAQGQA